MLKTLLLSTKGGPIQLEPSLATGFIFGPLDIVLM